MKNNLYTSMAKTPPVYQPFGAKDTVATAQVGNYDYTQDKLYQGGTEQTRLMMDQQHTADVNRQNIGGELDAWAKGRDPYYQALRQSYTTSAQPALQQQYADAMKSSTLGAAQHGIRGGSQNQYENSRNYSAYQADLGNADIAGQNAANTQKLADSEHVTNWKNALAGMQSGDQAQYSQLMASIQQEQQANSTGQAMQMENMNMGQNLANQRSQMYGGMLSTMGGVAGKTLPYSNMWGS